MAIEGFECPTLVNASGRLEREKCIGMYDLQEDWPASLESSRWGGPKEIETATLAKRSLPSKGTGQVPLGRNGQGGYP